MTVATTIRRRRPAEERRADVLAAAIVVFAEAGYAAPTATIARRAGIADPYLYRLFGTKRQLFLACHDAVAGRVLRVLDDAAHADGPPAGRLRRMLCAYGAMLTVDERRFQVNALAAATDPVIRAAAHAHLQATLEHVSSLSGCGSAAARAFYSELMFMNVVDVLAPPASQRHLPDADVRISL